jgi:outer membrane murein-binding lipoprotein Lpp
MIWRRVKRRFSISAPKLSVRPHIVWYLRWGMMLPFVLAAIGLAWWAYDNGLEFAGFHRGQAQQELNELHEQVSSLAAEIAKLNSQVAQYERQIQIEQSSGQENAKQIMNLTAENAQLQEDLSFFQNLTATYGKAGEVAIHRLKLERDSMPGEYHLRMLLVQSGQRAKEFVGSYQLVVTVLQGGQRVTQLFPQDESGNEQYRVKFKYYRRVEQSIQLSPDVQLESVQIRLFEHGESEPRVRQSVTLS